MHLAIKVVNDAVRPSYEARAASRDQQEDVGFDCFSEEVIIPPRALGHPVLLGIQAEPIEPRWGYMLVPRSSITKTPLRLSNSVGIIDPGYRGEIQARVDNLSDAPYTIKAGSSLFQLVAGNLALLKVTFVDRLSDTRRGSGAFGSTGLTNSDYTG